MSLSRHHACARRRPHRAVAGFVAALFLAGPAAEAATSDWNGGPEAPLRLIAPGGPAAADGTLAAAIEIDLAPGWKTYWRNPGAAGLPPEFDFSGSVNLAAAEVAFPAPIRFDDGGTTSAGYAAPVVLPLRLTPTVSGMPIVLALSAEYGVCRELCVPARAEAKLVLSPTTAEDPSSAAVIASAAVPLPAGEAPRIVDLAPAEAGAVIATARLADADAPADLFAEGPGDGYPGLPELVAREGTTARWRIRLDALRKPPPGAPLRLTLRNGGAVVEQALPLP